MISPASVGSVRIGGGPLVVIAGPCLAESLDLCCEVAESVQKLCAERGFPYIFKASYDKANRTSASTVRGSGIDAGLEILRTVSERFAVPTTTDIHLPSEAAVAASVVDLLQIPAFLSRQTDLLAAAAETGKPVNVKKGQFLAPQDCKNIVEKLRSFSASGIVLTERGTSFGYNTLIVDMPGLEIYAKLRRPRLLRRHPLRPAPGSGRHLVGWCARINPRNGPRGRRGRDRCALPRNPPQPRKGAQRPGHPVAASEGGRAARSSSSDRPRGQVLVTAPVPGVVVRRRVAGG